jgi:hypothetical protein
VGKVEEQVEDRRVEFVKRNWTGRFLRAEVNYYDYQQVMSRIRTWDEWLPAWTDKAAEYEKLAESAEARGARHTAAEAWRRASMCWHFGKFNWFVDVEKSLHAQRRMNACFERALWSLDPPGEKVLIPYAAGKLAAILRRPAKATKPPDADAVYWVRKSCPPPTIRLRLLMKPPLPAEPKLVEVWMSKPGVSQETSPPSAMICSPASSVISSTGMVVPAMVVFIPPP